jgi:hypothetical protein
MHLDGFGKHPLEGFCQETILLPDATFDDFFPLRSTWHIHAQRVAADASLFSYAWCRPCGRRTKHPSGSRLLTSRCRASRLPLAPSVPQKTVRSLPCPIIDCSHMPWLPYGARFPMAHGRGVASPHNPVAGPLCRVEVRTNQIPGCEPFFQPVSPSTPRNHTSAKRFVDLKGDQVTHEVIARPRQFVGNRLPRDPQMALNLFPFNWLRVL